MPPKRPTRSNCLVAAFHVWRRLGGRLVVVRASTAALWLPHFGVEVRPNMVVHFRVMDLRDPMLWFRGQLRRDYMGPE